jgi:undecaprenyl diphosphate synthase
LAFSTHDDTKTAAAAGFTRVPVHVAIIMDGNGRWAKARGLPRSAGHRAGVEAIRSVIRSSDAWGVRVLSLYAFSTENWKRPKDEISVLMSLLVEFLRREIDELDRRNVRIRFMGDVGRFPQACRDAIADALARTRDNTGLTVNIALNYGGRTELVRAVRALMAEAANGRMKPEDVTEETLSEYLYTRGLPDPDLVIRTSGEIRQSNFMLYQASYAEWVYTPVLWPDFGEAEYRDAILEYQGRYRRYGDVGEENR